MSLGDRVEQFSAGRELAVDVAAIERELSALWRAASGTVAAPAAAAEAATAEHAPPAAVTRACLWNLMMRVGDGPGDFLAAKRLVDDLAPALPARVLVLCAEPEPRPGSGLGELDASISANCVLAPGGGKSVCSEEITVTGRGRGTDHFPSVARALLVPDLPAALFWQRGVPEGGAGAAALLALADRLVVDTGRLGAGEALGALHAAVGAAGCDAADLGWLRLAALRGLVASLFDPPAGGAPLRGAAAVTV
ncbi:MAG TPA: glucose-6-phosphate dehydrogenase assembly protein OpcA, partial [Myxococcota bacterium]|nr:glucose-6-phosphate dehydrogenase assembly protein OpcA [Myxococcota bacterium]